MEMSNTTKTNVSDPNHTQPNKGKAMTIPFLDNPDAEQKILEEGYQFQKKILLHDQINTNVIHNSRLSLAGALDEEKCECYARRFAKGKACSRIVVYFPEGKKQAEILDGRHRFSGLNKANIKKVGVYVVTGDTEDSNRMNTLTTMFNRNIGTETEPEEGFEHAVNKITRYGWSVKKAAEKYEQTETKLYNKINSDKAVDVVQKEFGLNLQNKPQSTLVVLYHHLDSIPVLQKLAYIVKHYSATEADLKQIESRMKDKKSETGKLLAIDEFVQKLWGCTIPEVGAAEDGRQGGGDPPPPPPSPSNKKVTTIKRSVYMLLNAIKEKRTARALGITSAKDRLVLADMVKLARILMVIGKDGEK
jgi:hypothetical protein